MSGLDFRGKVGSSQVGEEGRTFGEQAVARPPGISGTPGSLTRVAGSTLSATLGSYYAEGRLL